jgi:hypothetical protein
MAERKKTEEMPVLIGNHLRVGGYVGLFSTTTFSRRFIPHSFDIPDKWRCHSP